MTLIGLSPGETPSCCVFDLGSRLRSAVVAEKPHGCAQGHQSVGGEYGEADPGADRKVAVQDCVGVGYQVGAVQSGLDGEGRGWGEPPQPTLTGSRRGPDR